METVFKCRRIRSGLYQYRGHKLERNDDVPEGFWGHWRTNSMVDQGFAKAGTLTQLRYVIDRDLAFKALREQAEQAKAEAARRAVLRLWKCDNGTYDVCNEDGVVYPNLPEAVARIVVKHDAVIGALQSIAKSKSMDGAIARDALAKGGVLLTEEQA